MAYFNSKQVECTIDDLRKMYEVGKCPECGEALVLYEGSILHCQKCQISYYNPEVSEKAKNPTRKYTKSYSDKKHSYK